MEETTPQIEERQPAKRLVRVRDGRWFGGVAAGLGRYFDVNPAIYRIVFAALALAGGTGILLYLAAWLVIPDEGEDASIAEQALRDHRDRPGLAVGVGLVAFALILTLGHAAFWPSPGALWLAALLVGTGLIWWELRATRPAAAAAAPVSGPGVTDTGATVVRPAPPRGPSLFLPVIGVLLATAGVFGILEALDVQTVDLRIVLAGAVVLVGVAIGFGALTARRVTGLVGLGLLMLAALAASLAIDVPLRGGVGDRVEHPTTVAGTQSRYRLAIGQLTVDLRDVDVTEPKRVTVEVGIGEAVVYVPRDTSVVLDGHAAFGNVEVLGRQDDGVGVDRRVIEEHGGPTLVLSTRVGVGDVQVRRG